MTRVSVKTMAFAVVTLTALLTIEFSTVASSATRNRPHKSKQDHPIVALLMAHEPPWPRPLAVAFSEQLSQRFRLPLQNQTPKTIGAYTTYRDLPRDGIRIIPGLAAWASGGRGGGQLMVFRKRAGAYVAVWDTLVPPSLLVPEITFADLDGDSVQEIIFSGQRSEADDREWAILRWDGKQGRLLAPRLDQPGATYTYNRMIGDSIRFVSASGQKAMRIELYTCTPENKAATVRVFRYHADIDGYLPDP